MKKLVLFAAIIAAVSLSACKKAAAEEAPIVNDTIIVEEVQEAIDTTIVETDSTATETTEVAE